MKIKVDYICPPIPIRNHDWIAYDDETYGGEDGDIVGYGATMSEAIRDFIDNLEFAKEIENESLSKKVS